MKSSDYHAAIDTILEMQKTFWAYVIDDYTRLLIRFDGEYWPKIMVEQTRGQFYWNRISGGHDAGLRFLDGSGKLWKYERIAKWIRAWIDGKAEEMPRSDWHPIEPDYLSVHSEHPGRYGNKPDPDFIPTEIPEVPG